MNHWQPTASFTNLKLRAKIMTQLRAFFAARNILEVETPLLSHATVTDLHLQSFKTHYQQPGVTPDETLYLQTSPEFAMKRLLAAGSGPIYQICKAFRNNGELGRFHNPEFTMLEWYRPDFDHHDLMNEVDELLNTVLNSESAERASYGELFARYLNLNPHTATLEELKKCTQEIIPENAGIQENCDDRNDYLHLLMSHIIEPRLGQNNKPTFVYDFPTTQAALAKIRPGNPPVAERFEVYIQGVELANGFHELTNADEQRRRFINDLQQRQQLNYPAVPIDENLLAALQQGLPSCAGIAVGIDRLIMLAAQAECLADVISFSLERA